MKKQLKLCKGFDESICKNCKRQNDEAEKPIVNKLASKVYTSNKVCQHYIRK